MTKKDFEFIAIMLAYTFNMFLAISNDESNRNTMDAILNYWCDKLSMTNAKFEPSKFRAYVYDLMVKNK